jgi:hypothetical protein
MSTRHYIIDSSVDAQKSVIGRGLMVCNNWHIDFWVTILEDGMEVCKVSFWAELSDWDINDEGRMLDKIRRYFRETKNLSFSNRRIDEEVENLDGWHESIEIRDSGRVLDLFRDRSHLLMDAFSFKNST